MNKKKGVTCFVVMLAIFTLTVNTNIAEEYIVSVSQEGEMNLDFKLKPTSYYYVYVDVDVDVDSSLLGIFRTSDQGLLYPAKTSLSPGTHTVTFSTSPSPSTLTSYIWEYLGNKIPDEIYNTPQPPPPQTCPGDVNKDGKVDLIDFAMLGQAWMTMQGQSGFNPNADFNSDGKVDLTDFAILAQNWMKICGQAAPPSLLAQNLEMGDIYISQAPFSACIDEHPYLADKNTQLILKGKRIKQIGFEMFYDPSVVKFKAIKRDRDLWFVYLNEKEKKAFVAVNFQEPCDEATIAEMSLFMTANKGETVIKIKNIQMKDENGEVSFIPEKEAIAMRLYPEIPLLLQNFPNPFNPETWIPYQLNEETEVSIEIYNVSGQMVRKLNLGIRKPGFYTSRATAAHWDGKNEQGEQAASDVYFYVLKTQSFQRAEKMTLLK